ncbi:Gfo/Idh/MocA family protein [Pontibacillus salicampi]|uniref:Gfo/Idh/MocA family protein n=1 Tax=Pontibacillus salicampi TaxID=1449801 RepID=A0ABV6LTA8_9BACI
MIRVALLSKWHVHATDYAKEALDHASISVDMIWDEDAERGKQWAEEMEVPFVQELQDVLSNDAIDGVIVSSPTHLHTEIISAAVSHGKHIFTEKVLAFTGKECEELFAAMEQSDVQFMISLPRLASPYYAYAQQVVEEQLLGDLSMIRCRVAHNGAVPSELNPNGWLPERFFDKQAAGGGALMDLGAHPIYLANRLAGAPLAVTGRLQSLMNKGVDDHAAAIVEYESGVTAVLESSFLSYGSPFQLELYGTEGTLMIEQGHIRIKSNHLNPHEWITPTEIPSKHPMPMEQWAAAILEGREPDIRKQDAYWLTVVNEAASLSHQHGRRVEVSEVSS